MIRCHECDKTYTPPAEHLTRSLREAGWRVRDLGTGKQHDIDKRLVNVCPDHAKRGDW